MHPTLCTSVLYSPLHECSYGEHFKNIHTVWKKNSEKGCVLCFPSLTGNKTGGAWLTTCDSVRCTSQSTMPARVPTMCNSPITLHGCPNHDTLWLLDRGCRVFGLIEILMGPPSSEHVPRTNPEGFFILEKKNHFLPVSTGMLAGKIQSLAHVGLGQQGLLEGFQ